jgi:hypothetical protein
MKKYEIWVGNYHLGQGHHGSIAPEHIDTQFAPDFKTACLLSELKGKLKRIEEGILKGNLNSQDYPWWFNENTISNSWLGKYYESKEEALKSFENGK